jgi:hypothetical protein
MNRCELCDGFLCSGLHCFAFELLQFDEQVDSTYLSVHMAETLELQRISVFCLKY